MGTLSDLATDRKNQPLVLLNCAVWASLSVGSNHTGQPLLLMWLHSPAHRWSFLTPLLIDIVCCGQLFEMHVHFQDKLSSYCPLYPTNEETLWVFPLCLSVVIMSFLTDGNSLQVFVFVALLPLIMFPSFKQLDSMDLPNLSIQTSTEIEIWKTPKHSVTI